MHYVYSQDRKDYLDGRNPLGEKVMAQLKGSEGYEKIDGNWIFYARIMDTDEYAVLKLNDAEAMGYYFSNRTMMAVILLFSCIFLVLLYIIFSKRMSEPVQKVQEAMKQVGAVVEGYYAAQSAWELAQRKNVDMPITEAAYAVLYEGRDPREALNSLMLRDRTSEAEDAAWAR